MLKYYTILGLTFFSIFSLLPKNLCEYAIVISPVVDIGSSSSLVLEDHSHYQGIPISGGTIKQSLSCKRIHQLIYHEIVEVIKQRSSKLLIKIPNFFLTSNSQEKQEYFWVDKKDFVLCKDLIKKDVDIKKIPPPINAGALNLFNIEIVTLAIPFVDPITHIPFSAGVRFKKVLSQQNQQGAIAVYYLHPITLTIEILNIPQHFIITSTSKKTEQIKQFVQLLKRWTHFNNGTIPYVWGGGSIIFVTNKSFVEKIAYTNNGEKTSFFELHDYDLAPKPGLDCSTLILRAAQSCNIPYYCKNSVIAASHLKNIEPHEIVEEGDIIYIKGHVLIVSSIKKSLVIEARSYAHGYGKVHEIELNKVFKDMHNFDLLHQALNNKQALYRLNSNGNIADSFTNFKILKLASTWKD